MKNENNANNAAATAKVEPMPVAVVKNSMTALQLCGSMGAVNALGQTLSQSGFFGRVSVQTATAAIVNCFLEGLTPLQYKAKYHTFDNGQTGIKSDFMQREFHRLGGEWEFVEWSPEVCDMVFTYRSKKMPFKVTMDEFKANGVALNRDGQTLKENWRKFPREMLKARCMATAIRALCPEAMDGMYTQEEVADFAPMAAADDAAPAADYDVCPCGSVKGKRWSELDVATLKRVLATPAAKAKSLTEEHRNAIVAELAKRETAGADATEVIEAEAVNN